MEIVSSDGELVRLATADSELFEGVVGIKIEKI